ncbi:MAG: DUF6173 family protein [Planktomarina sp.]
MTKSHTIADALEATAIPRLHETHSDPKIKKPNTDAVAANVAKKPVAQKSPAEWAYDRLVMYIKNFEEQLDADHEVAMGFTGGEAGVMRIEGMGFFDPDLLTFYGSDAAGVKTQQIQHVTQLNMMLRALPKPKEAVEPNRIGFKLAKDIEDASA